MPGREQGTILASMTLRRCDVSDAAVPMFIVVPMDEGPGPLSCRVEFGETFDRKFRPVFGGAEQRLGVRIVIATMAGGPAPVDRIRVAVTVMDAVAARLAEESAGLEWDGADGGGRCRRSR